MNNHDFYRTGDKIRKMCKGMTACQVEDLIQLMRMDLYERPDADRPADPLPVGDDEYRRLADALFQRGEAVYKTLVVTRHGDVSPRYAVARWPDHYHTVKDVMAAIDAYFAPANPHGAP